jgi:hypothetical protein
MSEITTEDYNRRIDDIANLLEAQQLLQSVLAAANSYFDFLERHHVHVSNLTIANHQAPKGTGPSISRYIDSESLRQGGNLTSRH